MSLLARSLFLLQDSISFANPSKKFMGKRFLGDTWDVTRQKYLNQSEYHKHGIISLSTMKAYRPAYILLSCATPLDTCLCNKCENCEIILKTLQALGLKGILANSYADIDSVLCTHRYKQAGTDFSFPGLKCIHGDCENCGESYLQTRIKENNADCIKANKRIPWRKWMTKKGKSAPEKCQIHGSVTHAMNY